MAYLFPKKLQGTYGVIRSMSDINNSSHNQSDLSTRYLSAVEETTYKNKMV